MQSIAARNRDSEGRLVWHGGFGAAIAACEDDVGSLLAEAAAGIVLTLGFRV